jgi:hypothetical protein
LQIIAEVKSN